MIQQLVYPGCSDKILMDDHHLQTPINTDFTITMLSPASGVTTNNQAALSYNHNKEVSHRGKDKKSVSPYRTLGSSQKQAHMNQYSNLKRSSKVSFDQVLMLPPLSSNPVGNNHPYNNSSSLQICETPQRFNDVSNMQAVATTSTTGQSINSQQFKSYFSKHQKHLIVEPKNLPSSHQGEVILTSTERGKNQNQEPLLLLKEKKNSIVP